MQLTKTHKILIVVAIAVLLTGGYIFFDIKYKKGLENKTDETLEVATSTDTSKDLVYKVEDVTKNKEVSQVPKPIPDLNRPVIRSSMALNVSERDTTTAVQKIKEFQLILKNNPLDFPVWMDLAMYQKLGGDYDGALISWKYAGRIRTDDSVSIGNIGHLYAYFIKDFLKAEEYYKKAISVSPKQPYLYTQLAEVYRDLFNDLNKAKAIIDEGLTKIPMDPNLLEFKASLN